MLPLEYLLMVFLTHWWVFTGTVDFSTPPIALDEARSYWHNAQFVLLPEFSHTGDVANLQPEAFKRLVISYFDTGVADDSLFEYAPLSFKPGMRLAVVAKFAVGALVVLPLLVVAGIALIVRRIRLYRKGK